MGVLRNDDKKKFQEKIKKIKIIITALYQWRYKGMIIYKHLKKILKNRKKHKILKE